MLKRSAFLGVASLVFVLGAPPPLDAQVSLSISIGPPLLPEYEQPPVPGEGYQWMPGFWAWGRHGYYWVPGTWVMGPGEGLLWTPGYWARRGGHWFFNDGYWGPRVGFYGGIDYGFGYGGTGFDGGYWEDHHYHYNRAVANVDEGRVAHVFNRRVAGSGSRIAFHGGTDGIQAVPSSEDRAAALDRHHPSTPVQAQHRQRAGQDRQFRVAVNGGNPAVRATPRPFEGQPPASLPRAAMPGRREAPPARREPAPPRSREPQAQPAQPHQQVPRSMPPPRQNAERPKPGKEERPHPSRPPKADEH